MGALAASGDVGGCAEEGVCEGEDNEGGDRQYEEGEELRVRVVVVFRRHCEGVVDAVIAKGGSRLALVSINSVVAWTVQTVC